jgi:hypothetical protein
MSHWLRIPRARRLVLDGLALGPRHVYYPVERTMPLAELATARQQSATRISWSVIWLKAMSAACAAIPELRQSYQRWPWPHLNQSNEVVGMLIVNRQDQGHDRICWARFLEPQQRSLTDLQQELDAYQTEPIDKIYRKQIRLSNMPWFIRRLLWRWQLNFSGKKRARRLGTFTQSTVAGQGANNGFHQTMLTSSLCFGPLDATGHCVATIIADHRVLDGSVVAAALIEIEKQLLGPILNELKEMARG